MQQKCDPLMGVALSAVKLTGVTVSGARTSVGRN